MANKERGEKRVTVGGKDYTLRPTFDALCELEEVTGKKIDGLLQAMDDGRLSGLRNVVWCLLNDVHAAEFPTLKDASVWIELAGGVDEVLPWVHDVLGINKPEQAAGGAQTHPRKGRQRKRARTGTGARSSRTPAESV